MSEIEASALARPVSYGRFGPRAKRHAGIRVTYRYAALPARVFGAWLDPEVAGRWLFATASRPLAQVEIDARIAGTFHLVDRRDGESFEYAGEYLEIVPDRRLVFTLFLETPPPTLTCVTVEIVPLQHGCELTLTHDNVPPDHASHIEGRWTGILYGLGVTLDSESEPFHHDQE